MFEIACAVAKEDGKIEFENGESISFEAFFKEYFSKFHAFANRFVKDSHACEDIVQETFISVWEAKDNRYESELKLQAFIYQTIRNKALNYVKHNQIRVHYSQQYLKELGSEAYMTTSVLEEETHYVLYEAIKRLTPQCQQVIRLHLQEMSNQEIAEEMHISVATVKTHKMAAYKELRDLLKHTMRIVLLFL